MDAPSSGSGFLVLIVGGIMLLGIASESVGQYRFSHTSPSEHIQQAEKALTGDDDAIQVALQHLDAVPKGAREGALADDLRAKLDARRLSLQVAAQARAQLQQTRENVARDTEIELNNLGYAIAVSDSDNELILRSTDFGDTNRRVRFLAFVRGNKAPLALACNAGFSQLRLRSGFVFGFSESYTMPCF